MDKIKFVYNQIITFPFYPLMTDLDINDMIDTVIKL